MINSGLTIIFKDNEAQIGDSVYLPLSSLTLPDYIQGFKSRVIWYCLIRYHFPNEKRISVEVLHYNYSDPVFYENQRSLVRLNRIEEISFLGLDTNEFINSTEGKISYKPSSIDAKEFFKKPRITKKRESQVAFPIICDRNSSGDLTPPFEFTVPIKNVHFKHGFVEVEEFIPKANKRMTVVVYNPTIREEFDAVKNYIGNIFKAKQITFIVTVHCDEEERITIVSQSPQIAQINSETFKELKSQLMKIFVKSVYKNPSDVLLYTIDDLFSKALLDKIDPKTLYAKDVDIIEDFLSITNNKHYRHLRLLSSKHEHEIMRLRFSLDPFAFVFLVKGNTDYHIIWETLNTQEATYIWNAGNDRYRVKDAYEKILEVVTVIKASGKRAYMAFTEDKVTRIYHDYSDPIQGFKKWKTEIEILLRINN